MKQNFISQKIKKFKFNHMEAINHCFCFFIFHQTKTREKLQVLLKNLFLYFPVTGKEKNQCIF